MLKIFHVKDNKFQQNGIKFYAAWFCIFLRQEPLDSNTILKRLGIPNKNKGNSQKLLS
jgi:hypothetical protein